MVSSYVKLPYPVNTFALSKVLTVAGSAIDAVALTSTTVVVFVKSTLLVVASTLNTGLVTDTVIFPAMCCSLS